MSITLRNYQQLLYQVQLQDLPPMASCSIPAIIFHMLGYSLLYLPIYQCTLQWFILLECINVLLHVLWEAIVLCFPCVLLF